LHPADTHRRGNQRARLQCLPAAIENSHAMATFAL
jgi:hypothetical protein